MQVAILILITINTAILLAALGLSAWGYYANRRRAIVDQRRIVSLEFAANLLGATVAKGKPGTYKIPKTFAANADELDTSLHKKGEQWTLKVEKK